MQFDRNKIIYSKYYGLCLRCEGFHTFYRKKKDLIKISLYWFFTEMEENERGRERERDEREMREMREI